MELRLEEKDIKALTDTIAEKVFKRLLHLRETALLTPEELARHLNVPKSWVYERTRNKKDGLPHIKVGKYIRFNLHDVLSWLKDHG